MMIHQIFIIIYCYLKKIGKDGSDKPGLQTGMYEVILYIF